MATGMTESKTAAVLIIGNEILTGTTHDINTLFIAKECLRLGIGLREVRVVADVMDDIVQAVRALSARYDYVFSTGGIGPTHDDITADAMAVAFERPIEVNASAAAALSAHYGEQINDARMRMARMPAGVALIRNDISVAPGFIVGNVYVMAGVPKIMQSMFVNFAPTLAAGPPIRMAKIRMTLPESAFADALGEIQSRFSMIDIGSYPHFNRDGFYGHLIARGSDLEALAAVRAEMTRMVEALGGRWEDAEQYKD